MEQSNYSKYRGKCKEYVDKAVQADPTLRVVRGHYHCPFWGKQEHWWCERPDGSIYDPTVKQFPTAGACAEYEELDETRICEECGDGRMTCPYPICEMKCALRLMGL